MEGFFIVVKGISYFRGGITAGESRLAESIIEFCPNKKGEWDFLPVPLPSKMDTSTQKSLLGHD
ncbi:hypothetical protein [Bacillus sp. B4EP4a]|uniref:hypothetical protein n=1 Tax=Bacillus sp. B4EP4a TaxID=2590665 RepID=UPI00114F365F|nr:hypothetical protein [Bacillus sp. B4EP4a]